MTYLVDAKVLSEPTRPSPDPNALAWLTANERNLVIDSIVFGELYLGVVSLPASRRRIQLERWFEEISRTIECLPWDAAVSRQWAKLVAALRKKGKPVPLLDGMIAATALEHGLTVATRDVNDFQQTGVKLVDPFA